MSEAGRREDPPGPEAGSADDIEILEVEGLPPDAPPPGTEAEGEAPPPAETAALQEEIKALREDLLRARADFENFRKRQDRERADLARYAAGETLEQILPVLDNFRRALEAGRREGTPLESFREGIELIQNQLLEILARCGLEPISTTGRMFDPHLHEAVARQETAEVEAGTIVAEFEPGWLFRQRLLKPARVKVAVAPGS